MKKYCLGLLFASLAVFSLTSCEDYFDDVPNNATSLEDVFSNRGQTLNWLTNVYSYMPDATKARYQSGTCTGMMMFASLSGHLPWTDGDNGKALNIIQGTLSPSTGWVSSMWTNFYRGIQYANIYLAHVDECDPLTAKEKAWTKAECRALRAYYYFCLVKHFGPVPIIGDRIYDVADPISEMTIPRSTVDECFDYILSEFDAVLASGDLVSQYDSNLAFDNQYSGNMTKEAVEGIRSVVLLFRASYLFNGDPFYKNLANQDGTKLFPQERDEQKWIDARDAAKKIIDNPQWKLVYRDASGSPVNSISQSNPYQSVFYSSFGSASNEEMIVFRTSADHDTYPMIPRFNGGSLGGSYGNVDHGAGAYTVPLEFVDLYFTKSGKRIDKEEPYNARTYEGYFTYDVNDPEGSNANDPLMQPRLTSYSERYGTASYTYFTVQSGHGIMKQFLGREPRFYQGITFQNCPWNYGNGKNAPTEMNYSGNSGPNSTGTHDYPIFGTISRKLVYYNTNGWDYSIMLRLAEVYLNYAEACAELGDLREALTYVNKVRARAGVAEYKEYGEQVTKGSRGETRLEVPSYTKDTVLKMIYRERIIELAFENKHYYDVRRWGVADGKWRTDGPELTDGWIYPAYHKGGEGGDMTGFNVNGATSATDLSFYKRVVQQHRIFTKRMSLLPIPQDEINRDKACVQTTGWESAE